MEHAFLVNKWRTLGIPAFIKQQKHNKGQALYIIFEY